MRNGVLCVGTITVDYAKKIDHLPTLEALVMVDEISRSTGGAGLNLAFDLKLLDSSLPVEAIGAIGEDSDGQYVVDEARKYGVEFSRHQVIPGVRTASTDALTLNSNGKRTFLFHNGACRELDLAQIDLTKSHAKILHIGSPGLHAKADVVDDQGETQWVKFLRRAKELGFETNSEMVQLEAKIQRNLFLPCLPYLDTLIVNESEAGGLVNWEIKVDSPDSEVPWESLEKIGHKLIAAGILQVVVIHTPAGAIAIKSDGGVARQGSVKVPSSMIKGTTGAGDAFAAGFIYGHHQGWEIEDSLKLGVAAAAQNIQSPSTSEGIGTYLDSLTQAEAFGFRGV
jgi:sugar/nucleoside kinase (ribokinase family)